MDPNVKTLLARIERLGKSSNGNNADIRRELLNALRELTIALQSPGELVEEILFGSADNLLIKIGVDLGIFKYLVRAKSPVTLQSLVDSTGSEAALLERLMRALASIHAVKETNDGLYEVSKISEAFAGTKGDAGARLFYDLVIPGMQPLPMYLRMTNYQTPSDPRNLPFNLAFGPDLFFEWVPKHPEVLQSFQQWMTCQREGHTHWLDFYPFEQQVVQGFDDQDPDAVLLVDVGGGMGQEIREIKARFPELPGRMILQDLSSTIERVQAEGAGSMEAMAHDFFTPQPIQGARVYYLRNILHDWDDAKCLAILRNTISAMKPGYSKVLVNEFAIADRGASAFAMRSDLMVMALAGAVERTEQQWRVLLETAGLRIDGIWSAERESQSIIEASLA